MKLYGNIFFLRHLKTQNNNLNIISGRSDSDIIKVDYPEIDLKRFDKIYCSPSLRCEKTLKTLGGEFMLVNNIIYDRRLLERDMGKLEGMLKAEGKYRYSDLFHENYFNVFKTPPEGEGYECFTERVRCFYNEHLCVDERLNILVCSHNQTLKLLRLMILEKEVTHKTWSEFTLNNGELTEIK